MLSFHLHINMFSFHFHWLFDRRSTFNILTLKSNFNFILHHLFVTLDFSIPLKIFSHPLLTACSHMTSARRRRGETLLHSDFLCIFGKNLLIFSSLRKGKVEVKFICFYAGVICEWSLISLYHLLIHYFSQCDCYYLEMSTETAIPIFPIKNSTDKTRNIEKSTCDGERECSFTILGFNTDVLLRIVRNFSEQPSCRISVTGKSREPLTIFEKSFVLDI